jgi:Flp pilus assembly protein TadG
MSLVPRQRSHRVSDLARRTLVAFRQGIDHEHGGQALVMVGLLIMVLIGFVALATDTGFIWMNRRSLQNSVDAAALAGVQHLPNDPSDATSKGCEYATVKNAVDGMIGKLGTCSSRADIQIQSTYAANDTIVATAYKTVNPIFGVVVGFASVEVHATATAIVGSLGSSCPFPIFQTPEMLPGGSPENMAFYTLTALHLSGSDNQKGNFLTVDVGSGANAVLDAMVNNVCGTPIGPTASTEPGGKIGKVVDGFEWRIFCASGSGSKPGGTPACPAGPSACPSADISPYLVINAAGQYELSPSVTRLNCTRLVLIPIFPGPFGGYNGKTTVTIQGFAIYYIGGVCSAANCTHPTLGSLTKGDSWGYYVRMATQADQYTAYNGFGTKVFALIN